MADRDLTERLPRDGKGDPITIGDRVWYVQFGVSMAGEFPRGYTPCVAVCDIVVGGVTQTTILPARGTAPPVLARECYLQIRDAFNAANAATSRNLTKVDTEA